MTATGTEARICELIAQRQELGTKKYGTTVSENPLGLVQWMKHFRDELLDGVIYVQRAIEQIEGVPEETGTSVLDEKMEYWRKKFEQPAQSTTLEDGSTLTASLGNPQPLDLTGVKEMKVSGFVEQDPHHELRKTWKPGQRWQGRLVDYRPGRSWPWVEIDHGEPAWRPGREYRRHPDDQDPPATEKPWIDWVGGDKGPSKPKFVQVRLRDGTIDDGSPDGYDWAHGGTAGDIVAYRVVK